MAQEIVSGSFRNISGTISSLDKTQGTITVHDLATKKTVTVKITSESQLRQLPAQMAQRIAQRLNGASGGNGGANGDQAGPGQTNSTRSGAPTAKEPAAGPGQASGSAAEEGRQRDFGGRGRGMGAGSGGPGAGGAMDLQQMISRMPASTIADLQKDDVVMLVGTEANGNTVTAITLLAGVEPILQGSPNGGASSILSPWSLSGAPGGDVGTP
jgi:hypothetical protein